MPKDLVATQEYKSFSWSIHGHNFTLSGIDTTYSVPQVLPEASKTIGYSNSAEDSEPKPINKIPKGIKDDEDTT